MATIGSVVKQKDGSFAGSVQTLSMARSYFISVVPIKGPKASDTHPDYRVMVGDNDVGAGWKRKSKKNGSEYVSLTLEAPEFGSQRLYCNLGKAPGGKDSEFNLIWNARRS
jgi:uncharacterized protein (DUF736 family)